jgi:hypothetical protein
MEAKTLASIFGHEINVMHVLNFYAQKTDFACYGHFHITIALSAL